MTWNFIAKGVFSDFVCKYSILICLLQIFVGKREIYFREGLKSRNVERNREKSRKGI